MAIAMHGRCFTGVLLVLVLWSAGLRAAETKVNESTFLANVRQLTFEGRRSGEGYFSPDGKALIFQSERDPANPFYQIYILDLETGDTHRVSPGFGKTTCAFFRPNSDEVLYASTHHDPKAKEKQKAELDFRATGKERRYSWDYDEEMEIYSAKRDGSNLKRLTTAPGYDAEGAYSPDGTKIVFTSLRDAYSSPNLSAEDKKRLETDPSYFAEIYIMDADGSNQRRLTSVSGYDGGPFFSPDGKRIVWRRFGEDGVVANVFTMNIDGSDVRQVTDFGAMSWAPYYHPSGKYLIFTANKLGFENFELFLTDVEGVSEPQRITFKDGFDGLPVFSPDGRKLCWSSKRTADDTTQLFMADWNHEAAMAALKTGGQKQTHSKPIAVQGGTSSPFSQEINQEDLRRHVGFLASDGLEGRLTGTAGAREAAEYIADEMARAGWVPVRNESWQPGSGSERGNANQRPEAKEFFQKFDFTAGVRIAPNANSLAITTDAHGSSQSKEFQIDKDFRPLSFTENDDFEGEVVFAGYGLAVPGKLGEGHDSYGGLNVSNKIVLVLRYVPEDVDSKRRQELNRYAGLQYKALVARNNGARAILVVSGPNSPNPGSLASLTYDRSMAGAGIIAASISTNVAEAIFASAGKDLKSVQSALDKEDPHFQGSFAIPNLLLRLKTGVERVKESDQNVIAMLPPPDGSKEAEYVLVGAHYDHLGKGEGNTLARNEEEGQIHNGADDNASGTALMLELAAALGKEWRENPANARRGLIFGFWSGEELGLIGASHFAEHPPVPVSNIVAYLNFDMVGRLRDNRLMLQGVGSSSLWRRLIEKRNVAAGFNAVIQDDPYLPTDVTALYPKGIPVLNFFTGSHDEYHRPSDDTDKLNYEGLERISKFARTIIQDLLRSYARPDYVKVEAANKGGSRDNLRAYLGTIPDYATEISGVKLSGVRGGSPGDKAGLKGGDVIVEFAEQKVANIYDYTYALDAAKIGQPVDIVVLREGKRMTIRIVPEARK